MNIQRFILALLSALALAACSTDVAAPTPDSGPVESQPDAPDVDVDKDQNLVEGQLIVGYAEGVDPADLAAKLGATVHTNWAQLDAALLNLPADLPVAKAEATASRLQGLRYAQPNRVVWQTPMRGDEVSKASLSAQDLDIDDPEYDRQWMHRQMKSEGAWEEGVSGAGVRIGIHDEFMDHRHPDLADNMFYPG